MMRMNLSIVAALALAACGGAQTSAATDEGRDEHSAHAAHAQGAGGMAGMCPMMVEGTTVVAEETEGGAALVFTTSGDVDELRRRVERMAEMHNRRAMHGGTMGSEAAGGSTEAEHHAEAEAEGPSGQSRGMMMPRGQARAEEIEGGARLVLTPHDPGELPALREHVGRMAEQMSARECPMMARREASQ